MKTTTKVKTTEKGKIKICSDYDSDCEKVRNPVACFIGGDFITTCCKEEIHFEPADGYCPIIHPIN